MKRPAPIPDLSAPSRRKRALSEEERALWESVAKQVKPLRKRPAAPKAHAVAADPASHHAAAKPIPVKPTAPAKAVSTPRPQPPLAPIGRRDRAKLSRGRQEIDARLDLHGMTQMRAHRALTGFLHRAHHEGLTFVLVITGKGRSGGESGVLRRQVPEWLSLPEFRAFVVGFEEASIGHGGEGALYVRIRRARF